MNIKVAIAAAVIGMSAHSANAATDTSCNPFLVGSCDTGFQSTSFRTAPGTAARQLFAALSSNRGLDRAASVRSSSNLSSFMKRFFDINEVDLVGEGPVEFDDSVVVVGEGPSIDDGEGVGVVPVPAAGFLLLAGLGGLAMVRRKKS